MLTLRDLVESALEGRDPRLLARCDVHKILAIFDGLCIFDLDTLAGNLATSFAELQTALQPAAAPAFLGLLAATMAKKVAAQEPLLGAPPSTPSTGGPPFSSPPSSSSAPPVVVTVKMNGKVVAERTTLTEPTKEAKAADKAKPINFGTSNYARATVTCADCSKPRVLFAAKALSSNEMDVLEARLDQVLYTCGASELFDAGHPLEKKVFVKSALVCGMPVEKAYYTVGKFPTCCSWCGETTEARLVQLDQLDLGGKKGYPICTDCHGRGLDVVTHGCMLALGTCYNLHACA